MSGLWCSMDRGDWKVIAEETDWTEICCEDQWQEEWDCCTCMGHGPPTRLGSCWSSWVWATLLEEKSVGSHWIQKTPFMTWGAMLLRTTTAASSRRRKILACSAQALVLWIERTKINKLKINYGKWFPFSLLYLKLDETNKIMGQC